MSSRLQATPGNLLGRHSKMALHGPPSPRSERNCPKRSHTGCLHKENKSLSTNIYQQAQQAQRTCRNLSCVHEDMAALCPPSHSRQTQKNWDRMTDVTQIASDRPLTLSSWLHTFKDTDSDLNMVKAHFCFDSSYRHR